MTAPHHVSLPTTRRNSIIAFFILAAMTALTPLSIDMYLPAFPTIAADFGTDVAKVEFSLTFFLVGISLGQLFYGTVADRFGRKRPMLLGLAVMSVVSLACALVTNVESFIVLRFMQALGVCGGVVLARTMVRDLFDHREAARYFSLLMLVMGVAPILAPFVGTYVFAALGWHAIFGFLCLYGAGCFLAVWRCLPETRMSDPSVRLSRSFHIYADILKDRAFLRFAVTGGLSQGALFAYVTGAANVFINHFGVPTRHFAMVFGINAAGLIAMSQFNRFLLGRYKLEDVQLWGVRLMLVASVAALVGGLAFDNIYTFAIPLFLFLTAHGANGPNNMAAAMAEQGHRAGAASALTGCIQFGLSFLASGLVSASNASTQAPLALIMGCFGLCGFAVFMLMGRPQVSTVVEA